MVDDKIDHIIFYSKIAPQLRREDYGERKEGESSGVYTRPTRTTVPTTTTGKYIPPHLRRGYTGSWRKSTNSKYYHKYLKYKMKYLQLKKDFEKNN